VENRQIAESLDEDDIYLGFVEFDDQGQMGNRAQANRVSKPCPALATQRSVSIVGFAHGRNHNASASDSNVLSFRHVLRELFDAEVAFARLANRRFSAAP
jgi:hypothetical protein